MKKTKIVLICLAILEAIIFSLGMISAETHIAAGAVSPLGTPTPTSDAIVVTPIGFGTCVPPECFYTPTPTPTPYRQYLPYIRNGSCPECTPMPTVRPTLTPPSP